MARAKRTTELRRVASTAPTCRRRRKRRPRQPRKLRSPAGATAAPGAKQVRGSAPRPQPAVQPGVRLGLFAAAKAATRTPHYLDDIRNVRSLVFGSNAIWPVLVVCVIAGFYSATRIAGSSNYASDPILPFLFQFLFYPVPLLPPMLAGFLAPRSTWLAGLIASFIATLTLVAVLGITAVKSLTGRLQLDRRNHPEPERPGEPGCDAAGSLGDASRVVARGEHCVRRRVATPAALRRLTANVGTRPGRRPRTCSACWSSCSGSRWPSERLWALSRAGTSASCRSRRCRATSRPLDPGAAGRSSDVRPRSGSSASIRSGAERPAVFGRPRAVTSRAQPRRMPL